LPTVPKLLMYNLKMLKTFLQRFTYAISGIKIALKTDRSYRQQFYGIGTIILLFVAYKWPLEKIDILFLGLAYTLILITELQNSSFEAALDKMHPEKHDEIGKSKDMAAGAVLTAGFFLIFVMISIALF
jgi:undecaprenol kinase